MFQLISFCLATFGSALAAAWDLKTTEIPDKIPHLMILLALILNSVQAYFEQDVWIFLNGLMLGLAFLAFGFVLYFLGQWGGGDAKVLGAIGFFLPSIIGKSLFWRLFPFPLSIGITYLTNLFFLGTAYMLFYAFVLSLLKRKVWKEFAKEVKASTNVLALGGTMLFFLFFGMNWYLMRIMGLAIDLGFIISNSTLVLILSIFLFLLWKFTKAVEEFGFKKRIPVSKLKVGDVLAESRLWEGITEKELRKIKRSGRKFVQIKEGVRFAPAFPLALAFTFWFGDIFSFFFRLLI